MEFSYLNPTQIHFGKNQIQSIAQDIPREQKVLVIYGGGSIKNNGVYQQVSTALANHSWLEFSGVEANPTVETLDKAVTIVKEQNIQFILAVGGGSVIDGSKYVAAAALHSGTGWDILLGTHTVSQALPLGVVLTLPATGSESNAGSVITKAASNQKLFFSSPLVRPQFAVMDPDVMKSLPHKQLINGIVDAWVHVCEQYITRPTGALVQDGYAETLLKSLIIIANQYPDRDNDAWRANLMWTANQALNGLIGLGVPQDWATHMIGHELTALHGVDHGRSLAIIQPALLHNQIDVKREKLEQMGRNVFGLPHSADLAEKTIAQIEHFYHSLDVATTLDQYQGAKSQVVKTILEQLKAHDRLQLGENQAINLQRSQEILERAIT
ncbi:NADH-dependent alcohol dehydrogenase ['Osedax' symbiont bacterium Rs2_46_30_T18]|nr:NADH-dependent alcohol dehydrogenase ['Osedax' symbiont bacterium Rs2_46_30_T18]